MTSHQLKLAVYALLALIFINSCASRGTSKSGLLKYSVDMKLDDKSGSFDVIRESGMAKDGKSVVSKYKVTSSQSNKVLEQSIVFSTPGILKKKIRLLRPDKSQYKVWFDAKLYQSETYVDAKLRKLVVKMKSPEKQWQGTKKFNFPGGNGVFCYFSQIVDCIHFTGFIQKAIKAKSGKMKFHVIWDGFPFIAEQYLNINDEPFAAAFIEYDGKTREGEERFSMNISGSVVFYLFSEKYEYAKVLWPAQGFSLYHK
jgi:hypothetical protein